MLNTALQPSMSKYEPLIVDFNVLFGCASHLKISPWEHKVDWVLFVHGEEPEAREYLAEAAFPLECIAGNVEYKEWYQAIPEIVRHHIKRYPEMGFTILYHISHYSSAYELFISNPNLLWLLLCSARNDGWKESKVISLLNGKRPNILKACGLPDTRAAVKLVNKLDFDEFCIKKFWKIIEALNLPSYVKFNHHQNLDFSLFKILIRFPDLIGTPLMHHYDVLTWTINTEMLLQDIELISRRLNDVEQVKKRLQQCKNTREVEQLHDRLVERLNRQSNDKLPDNNFPEPPIAASKHIIPIRGSRELAIEGQKQHHCVRSYEGSIFKGSYYVYKVIAPERATLGLKLYKNSPPSINQLLLSCNKSVSIETQQLVEQWLLNALAR